ncbi:unnamed protein product [Schistocephalus solidus]|uniref:Ovule protein n=1 Tax=Schistocephalus solidus TaxID=70667 RepID=A0A183TFM6_SCHSO|nr:unnamed protein product [Schistocephalus solidus]
MYALAENFPRESALPKHNWSPYIEIYPAVPPSQMPISTTPTMAATAIIPFLSPGTSKNNRGDPSATTLLNTNDVESVPTCHQCH